MRKMYKDYDLNKWPTISEAVNNMTPLFIAEKSGAKKIKDNMWLYKGKIVSEVFLEDMFRKRI